MELVFRTFAAEATLNHFRDTPFAYGSADCAHLCAFAIQRLGHADPLKGLRRYRTAAGARRAMLKAGVTSFEDRLEQLGFAPIPPAMALACDIVAIESGDDDMPALGISVGQDQCAAWKPDGSLGVGPITVALKAWRVPPAKGAA